jgi:hypothetical protein
MPVLAGTIRASSTGNPEWVAADGKPYYTLFVPKSGGTPLLPRPAAAPGTGYRTDWRRRVGNKYGFTGLGPMGFRFCVPVVAGNYCKLTDDSADT